MPPPVKPIPHPPIVYMRDGFTGAWEWGMVSTGGGKPRTLPLIALPIKLHDAGCDVDNRLPQFLRFQHLHLRAKTQDVATGTLERAKGNGKRDPSLTIWLPGTI